MRLESTAKLAWDAKRASGAKRASSAKLASAVATVLALAALGGCGSPCSNQAFIGLPAPDGTRIAFVFHRRCAAPANTTTEVTINDARQPLRDEPGNVVSVDGEQPLNVAWVSSDRLRVSGVAGKVNHKNERQGAVTVEFP